MEKILRTLTIISALVVLIILVVIISGCTTTIKKTGSGAYGVRCGDNRINGGEKCDGNDLAGKTCANFGNYSLGTLYCCSDCKKFDLSGCYNEIRTCTDNDGGVSPDQYYIASNVSGSVSTTYGPSCSGPGAGGGGGGLAQDVCNGNILTEGICNPDNTLGTIEYECPNGCSDGACIQNITCTDSDGGRIYDVKGTTCEGSYCETDMCYDNQLNEHYCEGGLKEEFIDCPNICSNGACIQNITCKDSDGGQNIYVKGTCTDSTGSYTEECSGEYGIIEYWCENNVCANANLPPGVIQESFECLNGCSNGACIPAEPDSCYDSDGGLVWDVQGTASGYLTNQIFNNTDYCVNNQTIVEYYCIGNQPSDQTVPCYNVSAFNESFLFCQNGACI